MHRNQRPLITTVHNSLRPTSSSQDKGFKHLEEGMTYRELDPKVAGLLSGTFEEIMNKSLSEILGGI